MRKILTILYLIFQILFSSVHGQDSYPIYVTTSLTPPYSLKLSDYCKFGSQQLLVAITVNDLTVMNLPVKLRIRMETIGVTIENPPTINTTPIYLSGGTTSILFGDDLTDYFNIDNLIFRGYSKDTYRRTGQLPEGFYKFTVEVLHHQTNRLISNQGTATAWFVLGKPPVLKSPSDNAQLGQYKGMPLTFSWLASNVGSPVSANTIQYKFEMWEMRVAGVAPNTVAASIPVFHEYTTFNTTYTLYTEGLLMEPGMQYAWRVTASDISGFVPFEQDGHSDIWTFTYKCSCDSVSELTSSYRGRSGTFSWEPGERHSSFNIEMRNPSTGWSTQSQSYENKAEFFDLKYGSTYEMRVQGVCDGDPENKSDFTHWQPLTIPEPQPLIDTAGCPNCVCDDLLPNVELTNFELRQDLRPGDTIINKTGTTRFILKKVESTGNGTYKGMFLFWAEIWKLKFICEYWDLQVNTDNVIVNMDFESVYDPQFLIDVDATIEYLNNLANAINELTVNTTIKDTLSYNLPITSIYVNSGDSVIAVTVDEDGNISEVVLHNNVDDLSKTLIQGENGEEYVVTGDGEVMGVDEYRNTGGNDRKIEELKEENETNKLSSSTPLNFVASQNQLYGFDSYTDLKSALQNEYPALQNGYRAPFKSVASFSTDKVGFTAVNGNLVFKDEMGIPALKSGSELTVRGSSGGSELALYAWKAITDTTEEVIGKLNILSYDEQTKRLYIVPVNGAQVPDAVTLQTTLNKIYLQAVTKWEVVSPGGIENVVFENGNMTHGGTSAITVYNSDQKTIVNAFENKYGKLEGNACYLFFVENVQFKERSIAGYMPLQRQVGYIYDFPGLNIVAHELGHGSSNLYHTFSPEKFIADEQATYNLMDYKGGTELWKHQWNLIHDPDNILFAFLQDEEEGEASKIAKIVSLSYLGNKNEMFTIYDDVAQTAITAPHFENTDDKKASKPVAYLKGTTLKVNVSFDIYQALEENKEVKLRAKIEDLSNKDNQIEYEIPETQAVLINKGQDASRYSISEVQCLVKFPESVKAYNDFKISWEIKIGESKWEKIGSTKNDIYLTNAVPQARILFESLLYISCKASENVENPTPELIEEAIWAEFADRKVKGKKGVLTYWDGDKADDDNGSKMCTPKNEHSVCGLLATKNGACGAWAGLLVETFRTQGIISYRMYQIKPIYTDIEDPDIKAKKKEIEKETVSTTDGIMLIKNQLFMTETEGLSGGFKYDSESKDSQGYYNGYGQLDGVPGQSNPDPPSSFINHFIVGNSDETILYDPSYGGEKYKSINDWENASVAGYQIWGKDKTGACKRIARKNDKDKCEVTIN